MKSLILLSFLALCLSFNSYAQSSRDVKGVVADTTKQTVPGAIVKLKSSVDSMIVTTDMNGVFTFHGVKGKQFILTIASIGYDPLQRKYTLDNDTKPANIGTILLKISSKMLGPVNIVDVNAVKVTADTTEYRASAYPVRANATAEEMIKKMPGVDVDASGNVTAQGQSVAGVRINGKDYFGGDVKTATQNLPADILESVQMIDDYGDQANLTGIRTGTPRKIMNFVVRKDKNYGYTLSATGGDGADALPSNPGVTNQNRYFGALNLFKFKGDQQLSILGSINNTNLNTFSFGGGGGGGGGRGNGGRGGGGGGQTSPNGITDAKSLGLNFRDEWGKYLSVYGSYSFGDNSTFTQSTNDQTNYGVSNNHQLSNSTDGLINHRFTWNMEFKPDTINYLKFTPTYSYNGTTTSSAEDNSFVYGEATRNRIYKTNTIGNSNSSNYGANLLYNHRFNSHGRNFSVNLTGNSAPSYSFQNPVSAYTVGSSNAPLNQNITVNSRTNSVGTQLSYIEPIGKVTYLEGTYSYNHAYTTNGKEDDTLVYIGPNPTANRNKAEFLSNDYNSTYNTNRFGLNYRIVEAKYNLTLGAGYQSGVLDGFSPATASQPSVTTNLTTSNFIPTIRFVYNFSRNQALNINYFGSSNSPSYAQLNPRLDLSNVSYASLGDPNLQPEFNNSYSIRYNKFDIASGNIFFVNASFTQTDHKIVANQVSYPDKYTPNPHLSNIIEYVYANSNNYYTANGFLTFAKPWEKRKYTLIFNANGGYSNAESTSTDVRAVTGSPNTFTSVTTPNITTSFSFTPQVRFRFDIQDVIDVQASAAYGFNKTDNTSPIAKNQNFRTTTLGLNGKNYFFTNYTLSYDFNRTIYDGYQGAINPNILNTYIERRFLKNNMATIRASVSDVFNQNTGYTNSVSGQQTTISNVNRLGRFYLLTLTIRLQKFAGQAPMQQRGDGQGRGERGNRGDGGGRGGFGGGMGGGGFGGMN
ncbi:outer membrane beta-barrel protein [Mucilaginibacter sp. HMF5004]|uniref:outer membrane beta-barrel protein n=1 Tax=Mucilaginibacter rivuli TaxID=2857527 RepID=UPI001C5E1017|nr:outer membrane beta-barrel protein [Mucilaginibacter rivuli]MBW4890453.1 outer membrane beta-barrel protein [Mucilaginibacter rivuli]